MNIRHTEKITSKICKYFSFIVTLPAYSNIHYLHKVGMYYIPFNRSIGNEIDNLFIFETSGIHIILYLNYKYKIQT